MTDTIPFGRLVLLAALVILLALMAGRLTARIKIPAPLLVLSAAAIGVQVIPSWDAPSEQTVERVVTLALVCILFDGGIGMGWSKFRRAAAPITVVGVVGTFLTVAGIGLFIHVAIGLSWYLALLVATAISPTDPAVVFSVLGQREISGRSGTILEGESGANDPVGIALMASLIAAGGVGAGAFAHIAGEFALQMGVGALVGAVSAYALAWFLRSVTLPSESLYPLRTTACAFIVFGVATVAHGSGFLAVFVAGILLGDVEGPHKREIVRFHSALASLAEVVAFLVLGLTVKLPELAHLDVWLPGVVIGIVLAVVVRPIAVALCLSRAGLGRAEQAFVMFAGLKGAVPILLGTFVLSSHAPEAERLYGIVIVVVVVSVLVQGSFTPSVAERLGVTEPAS
ncbi:cation:proton antiporter [Allobranchiibius sp. GilTou73]|uniref:cation:proton antiporter domain-containing protein n=1 Tax=Allobranchiibius sp. GilTou73 TaxID=2904523 RepID=UPI001F2B22FF|nr:cation:proton antiporter [Allobranchiibius sp. GilTou73]UIJ35104.1 cation:proton antiporter [Allobranchiibius sp. GilTou73]